MSALDQAFSKAISEGFADIFTVPKISTATIVCVLPRQINLEMVRDNSGLNVRTSKGKRYQPFSNSVTIIFDKTKTMKVFSNGKLHITGCTSVEYAESLVERFKINMGFESLAIKETKVLMLNTTLRIQPQKMISLTKMFEILSKESKFHVRYTPDIYQGLIIKKEVPNEIRRVSFLFFYTGSIIICGIKFPQDLSFALEFLKDLLHNILPHIVVS